MIMIVRVRSKSLPAVVSCSKMITRSFSLIEPGRRLQELVMQGVLGFVCAAGFFGVSICLRLRRIAA